MSAWKFNLRLVDWLDNWILKKMLLPRSITLASLTDVKKKKPKQFISTCFDVSFKQANELELEVAD